MRRFADGRRGLAGVGTGWLVCAVLVAAALWLLAGDAAATIGNLGIAVGQALLILAALAFATVGAAVRRHRPANAIGLVFLGGAILSAVEFAAQEYALRGLADGRAAARYAGWLVTWVQYPAVYGLLVLTLFLFPGGELPSRRWRPALSLTAVATLVVSVAAALAPGPLPRPLEAWPNPFGVGGPALGTIAAGAPALTVASLISGVAALATRYRRATPDQRRQIKWLLYAVCVAVAVFATFPTFPTPGPVVEGVTGTAFGLAVLAVPLGAGIGILRHRLYDIDLLIRRTLVYGALAALITACYLLVVAGAGALIGSGAHIGLSIVATAVAAVAFQPARARLTRWVNRLVVGEPPSRLDLLTRLADATAAAHEIDQVLPTMARIAAEGVGARAAVWLRRDDVLVVAAAWPPAEPSVTTMPVTLSGIESHRHSYPVRHRGRVVGAIVVAIPDDAVLTNAADQQLAELARTSGPVLENVRLFTEVLASRARILAAQDAERRRLERDLHDGAQQRLVNLSLALGVVRAQLENVGTPAITASLDRAGVEAREALAELRELARGIHPAILTDRGLGPAVRALVERSPVPTVLAAEPSHRLPPEIEATAYFVVAESLANAFKHGAPTTIRVDIACRDGQLTVQVKDDGTGGARLRPGGGLQGLSDRVAVLSGRLELSSTASEGTQVVAMIPCA